MFKTLKKKEGFTLIEILIVVAILAIGASVLFSMCGGGKDTSAVKAVAMETLQEDYPGATINSLTCKYEYEDADYECQAVVTMAPIAGQPPSQPMAFEYDCEKILFGGYRCERD